MSTQTYVIAFVHDFNEFPELGRVALAQTQEQAIEIAKDMVRREYEELRLNDEIDFTEHNLSCYTDDDFLFSEGYQSNDGWAVCIGLVEDYPFQD